MNNHIEVVLVIAMMAGIVYLTRASGYFLGLQVRHIGRLRPILETLPGCALMAIIAPAVRQGSTFEILGLSAVVLLMWKTNSVALATSAGLAVLILGSALSQF